MHRFPTLSVLLVVALSACHGEETPQGKRSARRALPSVSADHYSEVLSDGTYKYAYTGEHRYVAERRLSDGTVEGESLYIRPDGVPVKVHYFADKEGYRPKTEVLYKERLGLISTRVAPGVVREVVVPPRRELVRTVPVPVPAGPPVLLAPPRNGENSVNVNLGDYLTRHGGGGNNDVVVNNGGDTAVASPSVTAIVGPGGRAILRPEAVARTSGRSNYFRSAGSGGDVAIASPHTTAIVGAGGSVVVEPRASAYAGSGGEVVREVHHPVDRVVTRTVGVPVRTGGYVYDAPPPPPPQRQYVAGPPPVIASRGVVLVPPSSSYSYSYGYNAPDPKNPQYGSNSAYVNVNVNQ